MIRMDRALPGPYLCKLQFGEQVNTPCLPLLGGGAPVRTLGRRGQKETPLSQKSQIFASSPEGRAKAAFGGRLPHKLQFNVPS